MKITVSGSAGRDRWTMKFTPHAAETASQLCSIEHCTVFDYLRDAEDASLVAALSKMPVVGLDVIAMIDFFQAPLAERQTQLVLLDGLLDLSIERKAPDIILGPQNWCFRVKSRFGMTMTQALFSIDHTCIEIACE